MILFLVIILDLGKNCFHWRNQATDDRYTYTAPANDLFIKLINVIKCACDPGTRYSENVII